MANESVTGSVAVAVALALLASALSGGVAVASSAAPVHPTDPDLGVVTIWPNGTLSDPAAPITVNGLDYRFTASLTGSLVVERSGVVVNGSGYLVSYSSAVGVGDGAAVSVESADRATIEDLGSANASIGLLVEDSAGVSIIADRLSASAWALNLSDASDALVEGNDLAAPGGMILNNLSASRVEQNLDNGSDTAIAVYGGAGLNLIGNSIQGVGAEDWSIVVNGARSVNVTADQAAGTGRGIQVLDSEFVNVTNNSLSGLRSGDGVFLGGDTHFLVDGNDVQGDGVGVEIDGCAIGEVSGNLATDNPGGVGIAVNASAQVTVANNSVGGSEYAVQVLGSSDLSLRDDNGSGSTEGFVINDSRQIEILDSNASDSALGGFSLANDSAVRLNQSSAVHSAFLAAVQDSQDIEIADNVASGADSLVLDTGNVGLTVENNFASGLAQGLESVGSDGTRFTGNLLTNMTGSGVSVTLATGLDLLSDNQFSGDAPGITVGQSAAAFTISNNLLGPGSTIGIGAQNVTGSLNVSSNTVTGAGIALEFSRDTGGVAVVGNELEFARSEAMDLAGVSGAVSIEANNASDSDVGVEFTASPDASPISIVANDWSGSNETILSGLPGIALFSGNNLLNVSQTTFADLGVDLVDHNDFDSVGLEVTNVSTGSGDWNAPYPVGGNYWSGYLGSDLYSGVDQNLPGSDGIGDTPYALGEVTDEYPLMEPWRLASVTFRPVGLPESQTWSVTLNGETENASGTSAITFDQVDGAYTVFDFSVSPGPGFAADPSSGSGTQRGSDLVYSIAFSEAFYPIAFNQTTLPTDTGWSVTVNGSTEGNPLESIVFSLPDGSYTFTVNAPVGYTAAPSSGSVVVDGRAVTISVTFTALPPATFPVTVRESGLPPGRLWGVEVGNFNLSSTGSSTGLDLSNGTYRWFAQPAGRFVPWPAAQGSVSVAGAPTVIALNFAFSYGVNITAEGLPNPVPFSVLLTAPSVPGAAWYANSTVSTALVDLPNGTYAWSAAPTGSYVPWTVGQGTFAVIGMGTDFAIPFTFAYDFTLQSVGLPSGTAWSSEVTLVSAPRAASTLGAGPTWFVNTTSSTAVFQLANGTYDFLLSASGYQSISGVRSVSGAPIRANVTFQAAYLVTFSEAGLPAGVTWSVVLNGSTGTGTGSSIVFHEPNGTYAYEIRAIGGYAVAPRTGNVTVGGAPAAQAVSFSQLSGSGGSTPIAWWGWVLIGVAIAAAGIGIGFLAFRRRPPRLSEEMEEFNEDEFPDDPIEPSVPIGPPP